MSRAWTLTLIVVLLAPTLLATNAQAASADIVGKLDAGVTGNAAVYEPQSGRFFSLGGRNSDGSYSDGVFEMDPKVAPPAVRRVASLPVVTGATKDGQPYGGRQSASATAINGKVYLFGGAAIVTAPNPAYNPNDASSPKDIPVPKAIKDIVEFDPSSNSARTLAAQLPYGVWGASSAAYAGTVFVFGGFTFDITDRSAIQRRDSIASFDPNDINPAIHPIGTLSTKLPYALQDAAAALVGQHIYIMGGLVDSVPAYPCPKGKTYNQTSGNYEEYQPATCTTDAILRFNPSTENVNGVFGHLPYRAQFLNAAVVDNKAYVAGARLGDGKASTSIVAFDPTQNEDARVKILKPTMPQGTFAAGAASDGNIIYSFGGRTGANNIDLTPNVTRIDPRATPPWAPRAATARATGSNVALAWDVPAYDGDSPVTGYGIYRSTEDGTETFLARSTTLTYADAGLTPGAPYVYRITAINAVGESATSARATTLAEIAPPGAPASFQAFAGNGEVELRWGAPTETGGVSISGYRVYLDGGATPTRSLPPADLGATMTGLTNGVQYAFVVKAVNTKGEGAASPTLIVTPKAVPATPENVVASSGASGVTLSWAAAPTPVRSFTVLRGTNPAQIFPIANLTGTDTSYLDSTALRGRSYYYEIQASNDVGSSPPSPYTIVSLVSKPGAPTSVTPVSLPGSIRLSWQAPLDSGEADPAAMTYQVRRSTSDATRPVTLATDLKGLAYEDKGLLANRSYTYTIVAFNGLESDPSAPVSAAAKPIENKPPTAAILVLTTVVAPNEQVSVDASGSSDPDGSIATYAFDFGDGTAVSRVNGPNATHAYAINGTYTVSLVVTDNRGAESRPSTATIVVGDPNQVPDQTPTTGSLPTPARPPGSATPKGIPGPALAPLVLAIALVALARAKRRA